MRAIGVYLKGSKPTADEKAELERKAAKELGQFTTKVIKAWDVINNRTVYRLDAVQI